VDASNRPLSGYAVTSTSTGAMCLPASEAVQGAYRCFAGNFVYDPCWAAADRAATPSAVLCLTRPWDSSVTRLVSGGRLAPQDRTISGSSATPWGVQLSGGTRCVLAQGTHDLFAGKVVDYTCEDSRTVVLRGIAIDGAQWRVATATRNSTGYTAGPSTLVARAWFGSPDPY
jgi:hypothetical protein